MMIAIIIWYPNRQPGQDEKIDLVKLVPAKKPEASAPPKNMLHIGAGVFIALNFVARGVLALLETTGAPIFGEIWEDVDGDIVQDTSNMMLFLGLGGLIIFLLIEYLERWISDHWLLSGSFVLIGAGGLLLVDYSWGEGISLVQFIIGSSLIWRYYLNYFGLTFRVLVRLSLKP
jgi:hypothetical protein